MLTISFKNSFITTSSNIVLLAKVYRLFLKLVSDFLFHPPPSISYSDFVDPDQTALVIAKYGAAFLDFARTIDFSIKSTGSSGCSLPYIDASSTSFSTMIKTFYCGMVPCNFANLANCEANAVDSNPDNLIIFPFFRMLNRFDSNITHLQNLATTFATDYEDLSLLDREFRGYFIMEYFPPHYYLVNVDERTVPTQTTNALNADNYFKNQILGTLKEIYEDCQNYVKASTRTYDFLNAILKTEKDLAWSDNLLRIYSSILSDSDFATFKQLHLNKRQIIAEKKCKVSSKCSIGYIDEENAINTVSVPLKISINTDYALFEDRLKKGLMGMTSVSELHTYNDDENIAMSKCSKMISSRTSLCIEGVEEEQLSNKYLQNAPDFTDMIGAEIASLAFVKYKLLSLLNFAYVYEKLDSTLASGDDGELPLDPIIVADDTNGMNLLFDTGIDYTLNTTDLDFDFNFQLLLTQVSAPTSNGMQLSICLGLFLFVFVFLI